MSNNLVVPGQPLLFMKVGVHATESIEDIILRKQREFQDAGSIFWGYGGNSCHPLTMVQPFAKQHAVQGREVFLVMEKINSNHSAEPKDADEYSEDDTNWHKVPSGIHVRGSRYALILEDLQFDEFNLDLRAAKVAVGPSRGRTAFNYLQGRVDKGCLEVDSSNSTAPTSESEIRHISLFAKLKHPYAVFLR